MPEIRSQPCSVCPYRRDVPSGVWDKSEYDKLRDYDLPTGLQPFAAFACHATPDHLCNGWALCHTSRGNEFDLLALRWLHIGKLPLPSVPLFGSGNEAADHGEQEIHHPSEAANVTVDRLLRKNPRLTRGNRRRDPAS